MTELLDFLTLGGRRKARPVLLLAVFLAAITLSGCGGGESAEADADEASAIAERELALTSDMEAHFANKASLPPAVFEAMERGELTQADIDARAAAGEFPKFFQFKTPADLPDNLRWQDGSELPDLGSPEAKKGGTLYLSLDDFPRTLRRVGPDSNGSFRPWILDYTVMQFGRRHPNDTSIDDEGNFHYFPGIAASWALDRANKTVYVKINPQATFSDGMPITADDMMFTLYFYQKPWIQAPWYNNFYNRSYSGITRYDSHTFSMTLPEAKPNMLSRVLELEPLPKHFFSEYGEDYPERYQWQFVPTSGPYVVRDEDVKKGRSIAITRNKDWWGKDLKFWRNRFNVDRVYFSIIRDPDKAFESFRTAEVDLQGLTLPTYWYEKLPATDPLVAGGYVQRTVFYNDRPRPTYGLWMNTARPLLDNRDVRVGIQYASNWQKVIDQYFRGDYQRMNTTSDGYGEFTHPSLRSREYDVGKALEHFAAAGFTDRDTDGVLKNAQGQRLSFTLTTGYESLKDVLTILREEALQAGLDLRLEVLDGTAAWKKVQEKQHDIQFSAFNVSPEMYPRYWETYHSVNAYDVPWLQDGSPNPDRKPKTQTNNLQSLAIPELDALIEKYRASEDVEAMRTMAFRMEELMHEDASFSPGFVIPFIRTGSWRWVHYPDDFNVKLAGGSTEYHLLWIEPGEKDATLAARKAGQTFPPETRVYDQFKID